MSLLESIIAKGNRRWTLATATSGGLPNNSENWITCRDEFKFSVIAGNGVWCRPRPTVMDTPSPYEVASDFPGPFTHVEVGFPSERPEPWAEWEPYAENADVPTATVYAYVPVGMVRALVESHGGEA